MAEARSAGVADTEVLGEWDRVSECFPSLAPSSVRFSIAAIASFFLGYGV